MTAHVVFTTKYLQGYRMPIDEPVRPYALNYLAASGIFDRIAIEFSDGVVVKIEGADLIKASDVVGLVKKE